MQAYYPVFLTIHLFCAVMFAGTVFFEVIILEGIRKKLSERLMSALEKAIGDRAVKIMPWTLLLLYLSGISMIALRYYPLIRHPFNSSFGLLLTLKIIIAISVLCHFFTAMTLRKKGRLKSKTFTIIHISVFIHVCCILFIAKNMFYISLPL